MSEKIFNARFAQKIDTLTAWASSNIVLKAGEIAFATESVDTTVDGVTIKQPIVLAKIGDGSKTFANLPYSFYAKASDVHSWAKAAKAPDELDTKYSFALVDGKLQITETTYTDGVAGAPNVLPLIDVATQEELNAVETALNTKIGDLTKLSTENKADLVTAINEVRQAVEVGGTGSVVTVGKVHDDTNKQTTYTVKQGGNAVAEAILVPDAYDDTDVRALAQKGVDDAAAAAGAVETLKTTEVKANADAIAGLSENKADKATTLAGYGIDDAFTKTETEGKISKAIEDFTKAYITADNPHGAIDKLQEIASWIADDKAGAAKVIADVKANADAIKDIVVDGTTPAAKATADANGNVITETYATKNETSGIVNSLENGAITVATASKADDATKLNGHESSYYATAESVTAVGLDLSANYVKNETYNAKIAEIDNDITQTNTNINNHYQMATQYTDNEIKNLHTVAKSGKLSDLDKTFGDDITDIIFDAGNASGYNA